MPERPRRCLIVREKNWNGTQPAIRQVAGADCQIDFVKLVAGLSIPLAN